MSASLGKASGSSHANNQKRVDVENLLYLVTASGAISYMLMRVALELRFLALQFISKVAKSRESLGRSVLISERYNM